MTPESAIDAARRLCPDLAWREDECGAAEAELDYDCRTGEATALLILDRCCHSDAAVWAAETWHRDRRPQSVVRTGDSPEDALRAVEAAT